ncbi:MAG TPA: AmiS/UreI family transporter [Pseudonocardia sp.]|jgi:Zn-dependent protease with chaperone function|uniref:AmiS/UreI family transporter n=1 Tax=Pseudonocardia sp. TaxID=60912 RepID=UPI002ED9537C
MGTVGLFYVGVVLFINGLMLVGLVDAKAAAPLNLFVGGLQVVTPTYLIFTANGDPARILAASGLYLFGFTYLYVGIGLLAGLDTTGVGYFSLFVAIAALGYSWVNFSLVGDPAFGVIWIFWAFLWALFFVLLGLKHEGLTRYTGWVTAIEGWVTAAIPAFLLLTGLFPAPATYAIALGAFGVVVFIALIPMTRHHEPRGGTPTKPRVPTYRRPAAEQKG